MSPRIKFPPLPWLLRLQFRLMSFVTDYSRKSNGTVNRGLLEYFHFIFKVPPQTVNGVKITNINVDPSRNLWFRLYVPTDTINDTKNDSSTKLPVIVFFHGGGFTFMFPDSTVFDAVCCRIAKHVNAVVISVNYRRTPEYKYPCQYEDGFDTLKFLDKGDIEGFSRYADVSKCFMAGDSAGGNIAHNVSRLWAEKVHEFKNVRVIGLIPIQPFFGGEERTDSETRFEGIVPLVNIERSDWHWKAFLPEGSDRDHEAVNVFGPNAVDISKLKNFPPALVIVGGFDPLQDWQRRYYKGLARSGVNARLIEYPDSIHAFYTIPQFPEGALLMTEIKNFVQEASLKWTESN